MGGRGERRNGGRRGEERREGERGGLRRRGRREGKRREGCIDKSTCCYTGDQCASYTPLVYAPDIRCL